MKAQVVFESMFGNCRAIAEAVAAGLAGAGATAVLVEVGAAPPAVPADLDLLVVGGPNHYMALPTPDSRIEAQHLTSEDVISKRGGLRDWLSRLEPNSGETRMAIFDCRMDHPDYVSSTEDASQEIKRVLYEAGFEDAADPLHVLVREKPGPLVDGETERAHRWGTELGVRLRS